MGVFDLVEPSDLLSFTSSILLLAFAIAVGAIGRFRGPSLWFMLFEGGFALGAALDNIQEILETEGAIRQPLSTWASDLPSTLAAIVAIVGLALLLRGFPTRVRRAELRHAWPAAVIIALLAAQGVWHSVVDARGHREWSTVAILMDEANSISFNVLRALMLAGGLLLGVRYASPTNTAAERRAMALVASALVIYPVSLATRGGWDEALALDGDPAMWFFVTLAGALLIAAYWGRAATVVRKWTGWVVAWTTLGAMLGGALVGAYAPEWSTSGPSRILAILILGYAVLRNQLPGIDGTVRFAISKSTVAAVILAVVFVASEGAQSVFGADKQWLGLLAGAAVVFAISPLQRAADRLAEKAVPAPNSPVVTVAPEREEMYRLVVRLALRGRPLSRTEERDLFRLARWLGLEAERAHEILAELEEALGGGH